MNSYKSIIYLFSASIMFSSCGGNEEIESVESNKVKVTINEPVQETGTEFNITGLLDGKPYSSSNKVSFAKKTSSKVFTQLNLSGSAMTGETITIEIGNYKGPDTYEFGMENINVDNPIPSAATLTAVNPENASRPLFFMSKEGSVIIEEEKDGIITGTFSFISKPSNNTPGITFKDGKFNLEVK